MSSDSSRPRKRLKVDNDSKEQGLSEEQLQWLRKNDCMQKLVPYRDGLVKTRKKIWFNLKENLCEAILQQGQPLRDWLWGCIQYVTTFGIAITKEEHVATIKLLMKALVEIEHDFLLIEEIASFLCLLLKRPDLLTRDDLILEWRPLYELYDKLFFSGFYRKSIYQLRPSSCVLFQELISLSRIYFSKESTIEILKEWKQFMCVYSELFQRYLFLFSKFLPTCLSPNEHQFGYELWFEDFMKLWISLPNMEATDYSNLNNLFMRLSLNTVGFIDWEPYLPVIFQRIKQMLDDEATSSIDISVNASWLVWMITPRSTCLEYLKKLCLFPSCDKEFLTCLVDHFIRRLRMEQNRKNKNYWFLHTPEWARITPSIQKEFSDIVWYLFTNINIGKFDVELIHKICLFCPEPMSEEVIRKFEFAQERYYEPNRMRSALQLFSASLYHLVIDEKVGPKYRTFVIPILSQLMQSINSTDAELCYLHLFAIRSIVLLNIPLEDFSNETTKSNSIEDSFTLKLYSDSAQLDSFPFDYLDLCFSLIDSGNDDIFKASKKKLELNSIVFETFKYICGNVSKDRFKALVDKLFNFIMTSIYENADCRTMLQTLIEALLTVDKSGYAYDKFYPIIIAKIMSAIDDQSRYSNVCKSEFTYYFGFLSIFSTNYNGASILRYRTKTIDLFERFTRIDFENDSFMMNCITTTIVDIFTNLTYDYFPDQVHCNLSNENYESRLQKFKEWPLRISYQNVSLKWNSLNSFEDQTIFARELFDRFIFPHISLLNNWIDGNVELSKSQLEKSLSLLTSIRGFSQALPLFPTFENFKQVKYLKNLPVLFSSKMFADLPNIREDLINLLKNVICKLKETHPDNSHLFTLTVQLIEFTLFNDCSFEFTKYFFNKIYVPLDQKEKLFPPSILHSKLDVYYWHIITVLNIWHTRVFTPSHEIAVHLLFDLATCSHTTVRIDAQKILSWMLQIFPYAFEMILPNIVINLKKYEENYDTFKGTLHVLRGRGFDALLLCSSWKWIQKLWPALVQINYAEKLKIASLLDNLSLFTEDYWTISITKKCISTTFNDLFRMAQTLQFKVPNVSEIENIEKLIVQWNQSTHEIYYKIINQLISILDPHKLHWRFYNLGLSLLDLLIRHDITFPKEAVKIFLENLVHDSVQIRQTSLTSFEKILYQIKSMNKKTITYVNGNEVTSIELQKGCYLDKELFNKTSFYDKIHIGFYDDCSYMLKKRGDFTSLETYNFIVDKFKEEIFLDKMFKLHSLDAEGPEKDFPADENFQMWKYLFQIFKLFNWNVVVPRIERYAQSKFFYEQKYALEIMISIARVIPNFNFDQLTLIRNFFMKLFNIQLRTFNETVINYWDTLFEEFLRQNDIRRNYWILELLFDLITTNEPISTFHQSSALSFIGFFSMNNWRYANESKQILERYEKLFQHNNQLVRNTLSSELVHVFNHKVGIGITNRINQVDKNELIDRIVSRLNESLCVLDVSMDSESATNMASIKSTIFDNNTETGQQLHYYLETIADWVSNSFSHEHHNQWDTCYYLKLLPMFGLVQTTNETVQSAVQSAIINIASNYYKEDEFELILPIINKLSTNWSWSSRLVVNSFIENLVQHNFVTLIRFPQYSNRLLDILLLLLQDEMIEVRNSAVIAFSTFIAWDLIEPDRNKQMISDFKSKAANLSNSLIIRHYAILGLSSQLYAHRSIPPQLPDILVFLSKFLNDQSKPIQLAVNEAFKFFKEMHQDKWVDLKHHFTAEQFTQLSNVLTNSYYIS